MNEIEYIPKEGADKGKIFIISRMPAFAADQWARRIIMSLRKKREDISCHGMLSLAETAPSLLGELELDVCDDVLCELRSYIKIKRDRDNVNIAPMKIMEEDFEDSYMLQTLYKEAYKLNVGFIKAAAYLFLQ